MIDIIIYLIYFYFYINSINMSKSGELFSIKNLTVKVANKTLLTNINLNCRKGDLIVIIGPNGAGKSSLLKTIMHHYAFKVTNGDIKFNHHSLLKLSTDKIANLGVFYLAQNPLELEGVKLIDLYKMIANVNASNKVNLIDIYKKISSKFIEFNLDNSLLHRCNNVNFSGGQKKKNELIQMFLTNNKILLLDEIDSGCDVDSIKTIAREINKIKKTKIVILISHQQQLLKIIKPNKFITIANNTIVDSGNGTKLFHALKQGFNKYLKQRAIEPMDTIKNVF